MSDTILTILSIVLFGAVITHGIAFALLVWASWKSRFQIVALNERTFGAGIQFIAAIILGWLGANRIFNFGLDSETVVTWLSVALVIKVTPSIVFLMLYFTGRLSQGPRL